MDMLSPKRPEPEITRLDFTINSDNGVYGFLTSKLSLHDAEAIACNKAKSQRRVDHNHILMQSQKSGLSQYGGGLAISSVTHDSGAYEAGLEAWDLIVVINGEDVRLKSASDCLQIINSNHDECKLSVLRSSDPPTDPVDVPLSNLKRKKSLMFCITGKSQSDHERFDANMPSPFRRAHQSLNLITAQQGTFDSESFTIVEGAPFLFKEKPESARKSAKKKSNQNAMPKVFECPLEEMQKSALGTVREASEAASEGGTNDRESTPSPVNVNTMGCPVPSHYTNSTHKFASEVPAAESPPQNASADNRSPSSPKSVPPPVGAAQVMSPAYAINLSNKFVQDENTSPNKYPNLSKPPGKPLLPPASTYQATHTNTTPTQSKHNNTFNYSNDNAVYNGKNSSVFNYSSNDVVYNGENNSNALCDQGMPLAYDQYQPHSRYPSPPKMFMQKQQQQQQYPNVQTLNSAERMPATNVNTLPRGADMFEQTYAASSASSYSNLGVQGGLYPHTPSRYHMPPAPLPPPQAPMMQVYANANASSNAMQPFVMGNNYTNSTNNGSSNAIQTFPKVMNYPKGFERLANGVIECPTDLDGETDYSTLNLPKSNHVGSQVPAYNDILEGPTQYLPPPRALPPPGPLPPPRPLSQAKRFVLPQSNVINTAPSPAAPPRSGQPQGVYPQGFAPVGAPARGVPSPMHLQVPNRNVAPSHMHAASHMGYNSTPVRGSCESRPPMGCMGGASPAHAGMLPHTMMQQMPINFHEGMQM